ncbi:MAG: hypothetical protein NZN28_11975 [Meiothermus sp.]|uniref:hypothetical protein n=1 Tax=Meiothermus sp. TaxID=1955249 RepID=UPI0025DF607F|nr:hypothetical protein [Meiothermus sp.]MCS7069330.1 hypothetical protein [Meiothermus sp.]
MTLEDTFRTLIREEMASHPVTVRQENPRNPFYSLEQLSTFCPDISVDTWQYVARNHPSYFTWVGRVAVISAKNLERLLEDFAGDRISTSRTAIRPRRSTRAQREGVATR